MILKISLLALALATLAIAMPANAPDFESNEIHDAGVTLARPTVRHVNATAAPVKSAMESDLVPFQPLSIDMDIVMDVIHRDTPLLPVEALTLPAYASWSGGDWHLRVRGSAYRMMNVTESEVDLVAKKMLRGARVDQLPEPEQMQIRNFSRAGFTVPWKEMDVTMALVDDARVKSAISGGAFGARGGAQQIKIPYKTSPAGTFSATVALQNTTSWAGRYLTPGNQTSQVQVLNMHVEDVDNSQAAAYLVPKTGYTILSSLDSLMKGEEALGSALTKPFTPWMNMATVFAGWAATFDGLHFHYMTQHSSTVARSYIEFLQKYPRGSFDAPQPISPTQVMTMSGNQGAVSHPRRALLDTILQAFPERRFILIGDTSDKELMYLYPEVFARYPRRVRCMFLRTQPNSSPDFSNFIGYPRHSIMFFNEPSDLAKLDFVHGNCLNHTIRQKTPFTDQGYDLRVGEKVSEREDKEDDIKAKKEVDKGDSEGGTAGRVALPGAGTLVVLCAMAMLAGLV